MELILHIGAHRTGSTLIQQMLSASGAPGLTVWSPLDMRAIPGFAGTPKLYSKGKPKDAEARARIMLLQADLSDRIAALEAAGQRHLVISEENILGTMPRNFQTGGLYEDVGERLRAFAALLGAAPLRVGFAIRDYAAVWNSAYGYTSVRRGELPAHDAARRALLDRSRGWPQVAAAVARAFPDSDIMVWRQEDLPERAGHIAAALAGAPTPIPTLDARVNSNVEKGDVVELFSVDEREALSNRYRRHVAKMAADPRLTWACQPEGV